MILFSWYSYKIIEIKENIQNKTAKTSVLLPSIYWKWMKKQSSVIFELDNIGKKKIDSRNVKNLIYILLLKASFLPVSHLNLEIQLNLRNLIWKKKKNWKKNAWLGVENACGYDEGCINKIITAILTGWKHFQKFFLMVPSRKASVM